MTTQKHNYILDHNAPTDGLPGTPVTHAHLREIVQDLPQDYQPYGNQLRHELDVDEEDDPEGYGKDMSSPPDRTYWCDCSCGCKWYVPLVEPFEDDWGVCTNTKSHRCGLLTFEHMGCIYGELKDDA